MTSYIVIEDKVNDDYKITKSIINTVELMDVKSECHHVNNDVKTDENNIKDTNITETLDSQITVINKCRQSNEICSNNSNSFSACVDKLHRSLNALTVNNNKITNNVPSVKQKLHNSKVNETINHTNEVKSRLNIGVHCVLLTNLKLEKEEKLIHNVCNSSSVKRNSDVKCENSIKKKFNGRVVNTNDTLLINTKKDNNNSNSLNKFNIDILCW